MAQELILRFDTAQESRALSDAEWNLRKKLKLRLLGLAAIERVRKKQCSHVHWLWAGDASTVFFHAKINSRSQFFFHFVAQKGNCKVTSHQDKEEVINEHFLNIMGTKVGRSCSINWEAINLPQIDTDGMDLPFSEEEVWQAIKLTPTDRAPGPDGFLGVFYKSCWPIIKLDILRALNQFYHMNCANIEQLNSATVVLIPKLADASEIGHFRPISLVHSFAKLIAKIPLIRLAPKMASLISPAHSAFLKTMCIHDSYLLVRNAARSFHRKRNICCFSRWILLRPLTQFCGSTYLSCSRNLASPLGGAIGFPSY